MLMQSDDHRPGTERLVDEYLEGWRAGYWDGAASVLEPLYNVDGIDLGDALAGIETHLLRRMSRGAARPPASQCGQDAYRGGRLAGALAVVRASLELRDPTCSRFAAIAFKRAGYQPQEHELGALYLEALAGGCDGLVPD